MVFRAEAANGAELATRYYYLVGGGFVLSEDDAGQPKLVPDTSAACRASSTANRA